MIRMTTKAITSMSVEPMVGEVEGASNLFVLIPRLVLLERALPFDASSELSRSLDHSSFLLFTPYTNAVVLP